VRIERARATRLQTVLLSLRYTDRSKELAARGGDDGARGAALQGRLSDAHTAQFSVLSARWPVDTYRVCGYPAAEFGSMLMDGMSTPADLARHRAMLVGCVEQAGASVKALKAGNDGLEAAMKAVDEAFAAARRGPPGGEVAQPAAPATQAAATTARAATPDVDGKRERHEAAGHDRVGAEAR
jgi:hypothetical protein